VHRFGYAFCGEATLDVAAGASSAGDQPPPATRVVLTWADETRRLGDGDHLFGRDPECGVWLDVPGVSRRHAMIRRIDSEFEVFDLGSRNGTWLNARQLLPNQPYRFASGSHLRLGRMQLFIMYHTAEK
jgi:pSer/pThr/pTyr-binding forkhead associated (FHA) protein